MHRKIIFAVVGAAVSLLLTSPLAAQPRANGWGARMLLLPIMAAYGGHSALCNQRAVARAQWGVERIQKAVNPTASQRAALDDLKDAAAKAIDLATDVCPREIPRTSNERWVFTERRLTAIAQTVATIRPSFEAFYASLSEEQKATLEAGPRRWRWRRSAR